jgi:hypothetical protein
VARLEDDPTRAVELAEINRDARPGGEAQTKLLEAYLLAGRIDDALAVAELLEASPWSAPETHAALAALYALNGEPDRAEAHRAEAERLAPGEMDRMAWLRAPG